MCVLLAVATLAGCSKPAREAPAPAIGSAGSAAPAAVPKAAEWYRVVLGEKQGTAIPVFLNVPPSGGEAFIVTGPERIRATLVSRPPDLALEFEIFRTRITAKAGAAGELDGTFESTSGSWGAATLSFHAAPVAAPDPALRFPATPGGPDAGGVWRIAFPDQPGKVTIKPREGVELTATLAFETGNLALMAGAQDGRTVRLAAFDGAAPFLFVGELDAAGTTLTGTWTAGQALAWKEALTGERTEDFALDNQARLVSKRPKLVFPPIARYLGKPLIVELGGSWCPACGHASGKLKELQARYATAGLQVVTLAYEFTEDAAYNKTQAAAFKAKYGIPWDVIPVDGDLDRYNEILPPALEGIDASGFPITIFVAADGGIEGFHSGFPPAAWTELHAAAIAEYDRLAAAIVAPRK